MVSERGTGDESGVGFGFESAFRPVIKQKTVNLDVMKRENISVIDQM